MSGDDGAPRDESMAGDAPANDGAAGRLAYTAAAGAVGALFACWLGPPLFTTSDAWRWGELVRSSLIFTVLFAVPSLLLAIRAFGRAARGSNPRGVASAAIWISGLAVAVATLQPIVAIPAYNRAHAAGRRRVCLDDCRLLATAMLMYAYDYDEKLALADNWSDAVAPYMRSHRPFVCREAPELRSGVAFNRALSGALLTSIREPERTVLLYDSDLGWNGAGGPQSLCHPPRHRGGNTVAFVGIAQEFCKGVKTVPPEDETALKWKP